MTSLPQIAILGRPNVGKSTLFNRLAGRRRALVGNEPGMTRDRMYATADWLGKRFEIVDTGGMLPREVDLITSEILRHALMAVEDADHLVLVVDACDGISPLDEELAAMLRRSGKPLTLAVNKVDVPKLATLAADFASLGFEHVFPISAEHGLGVDDLLDHVTAQFPAAQETSAVVPKPVSVAIIGRPNVGKSTLLNRLLNRERSIVTAVPGTTRDAVDAEVDRDGLRFRFVDTAGIRRKGKTRLLAEKLSVIQARKHLEQADVALLVIDAEEGITAADAHIGGYAHESGRSVILVVNKWDTVKKDQTVLQQYTQALRRRMKFLDYAPAVFVSALRNQRIDRLWQTIVEVAGVRNQRISTSELNAFLKTVDFDRAPGYHGKRQKILYITQASTSPPTFVVFTGKSGKAHFSFKRFLENRLREKFGFQGSPIIIRWRDRAQP